ncbi:type-F conjugative transfer system secretin TraK [bacterium]|nr:type-F conjugative transfer system secretin TraK [bacterium]
MNKSNLNKFKITVVFFCLLLLISGHANAGVREVFCKGEPVRINLVVGELTEVGFLKQVRDTIVGFSREEVSIESKDNKLFLKPFTMVNVMMFVCFEDGSSMPLDLRTVEEAGDVQVYIRTKTDIAQNKLERIIKKRKTYDHLSFIADMVERRFIPEATVREGGGEVVYEDKYIRLRLIKIYDMVLYHGYVLHAENRSTKTPVMVPVQEIYFPGLLAVTSEREMLEKRGQGAGWVCKVYMVIE